MVVYYMQDTLPLAFFASCLKYFAYIHIFLLNDLISMMLNPPCFEGLEIN